jgi:hypothetical protein
MFRQSPALPLRHRGKKQVEFTVSTALRTSDAILGELIGIVDLVLRARIP